MNIERQLISILLNRNEAINSLRLKPNAIQDVSLRNLLKDIIDCYKEHKVILPIEIIKKNPTFDLNLYIEILVGELFLPNSWEDQLENIQNNILINYKQDVIQTFTKQLEKKEITYEEFNDKVRELEKIKIISDKYLKNINEIDLTKEVKTYVLSGCDVLDEKIRGFILGELSVWSGSNASGKSSYLNQLALMSIDQGYKTVIFSGELTDRRLLSWLLMQSAGKKHMKYSSTYHNWYVPKETKEKIVKYLNGRLFIYDNEKGNNSFQIIDAIVGAIKSKGAKVIILDNLMSIQLDGSNKDKYEAQKLFIMKLSEIAKRHNVHIHFVAHPRKTTSFLRKIDISGTSDLTNIADNVFITHRVNNDFTIRVKDMFKWGDEHPIFNYTNVIEVCKNREFGVEDYFAGLYFELESKRMLNKPEEKRRHGWEVLDDSSRI